MIFFKYFPENRVYANCLFSSQKISLNISFISSTKDTAAENVEPYFQAKKKTTCLPSVLHSMLINWNHTNLQNIWLKNKQNKQN